MKRTMFATLAFVVLTALVSLAQEPANSDNTKPAATQEKQEQKPTSHTKTVTGCLQKGDEAGEFAITGEDGKTWELTSKSVKLDEHVGHQVTVTGSARRESKAEEKAEKKEGQMEKAAGKQEYGDLRVTDLKMVSETLQQVTDFKYCLQGQHKMLAFLFGVSALTTLLASTPL